MKALLLLSDLKIYKHLYDSFNSEQDIASYIVEAQLLDLKKWLGDAFLLELVDQKTTNTLTEANKLAIFGGAYAYEGQTYYTEGIRAALAYYTYARFIQKSGSMLTGIGALAPKDDLSDPVSPKTLALLRADAFESAEAHKMDVVALLNRKIDTYPLYAACNARKAGRKQRIRIIGN